MLKNNFGLKKLGFGGARTSTPTRLASAIQDPSATNGLVSGGNWATGITSGVKGFLTGLGAMKDLQNERAYEQDMEKKYQDQLATEAADKKQDQENWKATFDQNKANADRNYNLSLLTAGFDPERMGDQAYVQEVLDKKRTQAKGEFAHAMSVIDSPEFKNMPKDQQQRWIDFANTRAKGLETVYNQSKAGEMGKQFLVQDPTTGKLIPVKGSTEDIKREEKKKEVEEMNNRLREKSSLMIKNIQDAIKLVKNPLSVGFGGSIFKHNPYSDAGKLKALLETIVNNIGLDELISVKKAGGTFGALSEKELEALQSALGSLKQGGNPEVLQQNLNSVLNHYQNLLNDTYTQTVENKETQGNQSRPENTQVLEQYNQKYGL